MNKKLLTAAITAASIFGISGQANAGGIITNTNQSAQFIRMLSRNAAIDFDAVYFNPAGMSYLKEGFLLSYGHQICFQKRTTTDSYALLNNNEYEGDVFVPAFPTIQATWRKNKWSIGFAFGPNGGGGTAEYDNGLASFERSVSNIPAALTAAGIECNNYSADINFKGGSAIYGLQLNAAYAITDNFSFSLGGRYVYVKNHYEGSISNIMINPVQAMINPDGNMISAPTFFSQAAQMYTAAAAMYTGTQAAQMTATAAKMNAYAQATSGMEVDADQTGSGFCPIIGFDWKINDKLNFAVKYEFNTAVELTNESEEGKDGNGMFKNDSTFNKDIPAILAAGLAYNVTDKFRASASYTLYFDQNADWMGREDKLDNDLYELSLGLEYDINSFFTISCGYQRGFSGATDSYNNDMDYSLRCNTYAIGGRFNLSEKLKLDFGWMSSHYDCMTTSPKVESATNISHVESFDKINNNIAVGISYIF